MKKITVSAQVEITPSLDTAKRIIEHVLETEYMVPVSEQDVDIRLGVRSAVYLDGEHFNSNPVATGLVLALHCLQEEKVSLPKVLVVVVHEEGAFVVKVNGRVIRNFMESAAPSQKNRYALRDMAVICGEVTTQSLESLGFTVSLVVSNNVQEFKSE